MKVGGQRGIWVEVWPNLDRGEPFPPSDADVVIGICELGIKRSGMGLPAPRALSSGGGEDGRRWIGFVPESAVEEFRAVLKQYGIELEVEES